MKIGVGCLLLVAVSATGCAYGATAPARQMEAGETRTTGTVSWGATRVAPHAELAQRFGSESGDLGIHAGWAVPVGANAGASARAYPAPWLNAGLHVDGGVLFPLAGVVPGWLAWTTRLTTSTTDSRRLYGGLQVNFTQYFQRGFGSPIWVGGIVSGYEFTFGSTVAQLELVLTPLVHQPFDELTRREQPRMALDQWGLAPGPFEATATGVAQSSLFTQLNITIYNR